MSDGSIVLGTMELKAKTLELRVNSESRAERRGMPGDKP